MASDVDTLVRELCTAVNLPIPDPHDVTRVAVFGVWNAGKSTLIKRLLVELEKPIPDWLTVAGAPETNFVGTISIDDDTTLVDTPGISDGMSLHVGEAAEALKSADVVLVLLLPSIVTAEKDEILAVLAAEPVHPDGWPWPEHGLKVLVSQLDEFGLSPVDDAIAFEELAAKKLEELTRILSDGGFRFRHPPGYVIADLAGEVADDRDGVEASDYERGPWDGIEPLLEWLRQIPHDDVRHAGAVRRAVADAVGHASSAREAAAALDIQLRTLAVEIDERKQALSSVDLQAAEARGALAADLESFAASIYSEDLGEGEAALGSRQKEVVDRWFDRQRAWLSDAHVDFAATATFTPNSDSDVQVDRPLSVLEELITSGQLSEGAIRVLETVFDADADTLKKELDKLTGSDDYWKHAERIFKTENQARFAKTVLVVERSLPVLLELQGLIQAFQADPTPEHERRVSELRGQVRAANEEAVNEASAALGDLVELVRGPLSDDIDHREELMRSITVSRDDQTQYADLISDQIERLRAAVVASA